MMLRAELTFLALLVQLSCVSQKPLTIDAKSNSGKMFEGCRAQRDGDGSINIHCGKVVLRQSEYAASNPDRVQASALASKLDLVRHAGDDVKIKEVWIMLRGTTYPAVSFSGVAHTPQTKVRSGYVLTTQASKKRVRVLTCAGPAKVIAKNSYCLRLLDQLQHSGIPKHLSIVDYPPEFVGRALQVPAGCQIKSSSIYGSEISCVEDGAQLLWFAVDTNTGELSLDLWLQHLPANVTRGQVVQEPCTLEEQRADCRSVGFIKEGRSCQSLAGTATVRGARVFAFCTSCDLPQHRVCNNVITNCGDNGNHRQKRGQTPNPKRPSSKPAQDVK